MPDDVRSATPLQPSAWLVVRDTMTFPIMPCTFIISLVGMISQLGGKPWFARPMSGASDPTEEATAAGALDWDNWLHIDQVQHIGTDIVLEGHPLSTGS